MAEANSSATDLLRETGLRPTKARQLILEHLASRLDHPSTDAILEGLRRAGHRLGTATVYQNLNKLAAAGLVGRLVGPDGLMRFDATVEPHPHAVCRRCSAVVDASIDGFALERLEPVCPRSGSPLEGWTFDGLRVELTGLCAKCSERDPRP